MGYTLTGSEIYQLKMLRKPFPNEEDSELVSFLHSEAQVIQLVGTRPTSFLEGRGREFMQTAIVGYFSDLYIHLNELHIEFVEVEGSFVSALAELREVLQTHRSDLTLGASFIRY